MWEAGGGLDSGCGGGVQGIRSICRPGRIRGLDCAVGSVSKHPQRNLRMMCKSDTGHQNCCRDVGRFAELVTSAGLPEQTPAQ